MLIKNKMCNCKDCKGITLLKGSDGVGIVSITDNGNGTFTILLSNGNTFVSPNYTGPEGVGIDEITWTSNSESQPQGTPGTIDTYTIYYTDESTDTYTVGNGDNGQGVDHTAFDSTTNPGGTKGAAGYTDTYTVWGDEDETIDLGSFIVYNGADGIGGDCCPVIGTADNEGPATITIRGLNALIINEYDLTSYSNFILPTTADVGQYVEIVDNKTSLPSQTRVTANTGQTIFYSGVGTTTVGGSIQCENSVNGSIKLVCVTANTTWAVTNYNYDSGAGILYPNIF
jgi:hypothetical protein